MATYAAPPLTLVRGEGAQVWDETGKSYLDLVAGIAVNVLGHAHPAVVEAVSRQVATLGHTSNLVANEPSVRLAERLLGLTGRDGKVFFANSGAEANEAAFKLARRTGRAADRRHRRCLPRPHDGRSRADRPAGASERRSSRCPAGHVRALRRRRGAARRRSGRDTAAMFLEPIQGEAGVVPPPEGYLAEARAHRHRGRCAARARRGADRHRPHRRVVRPPARGCRPRRADAGQGAGRGPADRRLPRLRRRRVVARARAARQHVRRQPGVVRGRARRSRHDRAGRPLRRTRSGGGAARDRRRDLSHPLVDHVRGAGPDARHRAHRAGRRRGRARSHATTASW